MIIFNRTGNNNVSVSVLDGTNPKYVYIPAIYYDGVDYNVTSISENGFSELTNLENIFIPYSIVSIDDGALTGCTKLSTLDIPTSVTYIGANAFSECTSLTTITIPDSVITIGDGAFSKCSNIRTINIPASVSIIGSNLFSETPNNIKINIASGNTAFTTDGKATFNSDYTILQKYYTTTDSSYTIPPTVISCDNYSFQKATSLTTMTIPSTLNTAGNYMFYRCTGLTSVVVSSGITDISTGMFSNCSGLTNILLSTSVTSIGDYGFSGCGSLETIDLTHITSIGSYAFFDCSNISSLYFNNQLTSIGSSAFSNCTSITAAISIPESVTSIGSAAFANCSSIPYILFHGNYPTFGTNALNSDIGYVYYYPNKSGWTNYGTINGISTIALVYISGTFTQQQTLTANTRLIESGIVPSGTTFTYQWYEDSSPISGETNSTLVLKYNQVDKSIHVVVSYNIGGSLTSITSISSSAVDAFNNSPTGTVSISGSNTPSSLLTATNTIADVDGLGTFYYQWYKNPSSSNIGGTAITDASNSTYTITGDDVNKYIYVKLYYTDNYGTPEVVYSSPTLQIVGSPPTNVSGTATSATTASISFTPSSGSVTRYTVTSSSGGITRTGLSSPIDVSGLTANTAYTFTMTSTYGSYTTTTSEASNEIKTYITAPTSVVATATGTTTATVTFNAPSGGSANTITYDLSGAYGGSYDLIGTTYTVINLSANTTYTFTVKATSTTNTTSATAAAITTAPAAPTGVSASVLSSTSARISFTGSTGATSYTVTSSPGGFTGTGSTSPIDITGLSSNTAYTFTVTATNTNGTSPSSTASSSITTSQNTVDALASAILWLDASDPNNNGTTPSNGSTISTWYDKSGGGRNATASTPITYNTSGLSSGYPALTFVSSTSQWLTGNVNITTNKASVFAVCSIKNTSTSAARIIGFSSGSGVNDYSDTRFFGFLRQGDKGIGPYRNGIYTNNNPNNYSQPYLTECWFDGTKQYATVQKGNTTTIVNDDNSGTFGISYYTVAANPNTGDLQWLTGSISEIIVFDTSLTTSERQQVEGYLSWKWGLQTNLPSSHPYHSAAP